MASNKLLIDITPVISTVAIKAELARMNKLIQQNKINIPIKPINKKVLDSVTGLNGRFKELISAVGKVAIWTVATSAIFGTVRAVKNLIKEFINLEDQLIAIERVTSGLSMEKIFDESLDAANELGVGIKGVLETIEELGRTYADLDETQLRLAASNAVLLASVTDLTTGSAVSGLIAITQAYNIAIEDSIGIVDSLNIVNNNFAIGAADLTKSLERSASAAAEVGVSFENLIGFTTAIKTSTRESGSVIGNSLKTILIRLQSNSVAIREVEQAGVAVYGPNGQLRDAQDIVKDLANKWDGLSKNQKVNIGVAAAGKRQYTRFAALMQNFDIATRAANEAVSNQGNALEENEKRMKTITAQTEILSNNALDLAKSFGQTLKPILVSFVKIAQGMLVVMKFVIDTFGSGGIIVGVFALSVFKLIPILKMAKTQLIIFNTLVKAQTVLMSAVPWIAAAAAITFIISQLVKLNKERKEEIRIQKESIETLTKQSKTIKELVERYKELKSVTSKTVEQDKEILDIESQLVKLLPMLTTVQDQFGNSTLLSVNLLQQEIDLLNKVSMAKAIQDVGELSNKMEELSKNTETTLEIQRQYLLESGVGFTFENIEVYIGNLQGISDAFEDGRISADEATEAIANYNKVSIENMSALNSYTSALELSQFGTLDLDKATQEAIDTFKDFVISEELIMTNLAGIKDAMNDLVVGLASGEDATIAVTDAFDELGFSYDSYIDRVAESANNIGFTEAELNSLNIFNDLMNEVFGVTEDSVKAFDKAVDIVKLYGDATDLSESQQVKYNKALEFLSEMLPELDGNIESNMNAVLAFSNTWNMAINNQEAFINSVANGVIPVVRDFRDELEELRAEMGFFGNNELAFVDEDELRDVSDIMDDIISKQDDMSDKLIDNLENEKDAFTDMIDHQLSELDRLRNAEEFEDTVKGFESEQAELEKKIARLSGDTSIEGIAKRRKLEEELADSRENLEKEVSDREFDLKKQSLEAIQDMIVNDYNVRIEKEKNLNEIIKERLQIQSATLANDLDMILRLEDILNRSDSDGVNSFFKGLVGSGLFDFSGADVSGKFGDVSGASDQSVTVEIGSIVLHGTATLEDAEMIGNSIQDVIKKRRISDIIIR